MGVLFDYFSAAGDDEAAAVLDWSGGPACPPDGMVPKDTTELKGIDPFVMMGTLEALLTGDPYEDIVHRPRHASPLRLAEGDESGVVTLTGEFAAALATATDERIEAVARPWSETDEFWGYGEPAELSELIRGLRDLAVRATERDQHLYCWFSL